MKYDTLSDEELIIALRDGDEKVIDIIIDKYKDLVRKKAGSMFILGADKEDLIQEGMIGLYKAVRDYDDENSRGDGVKLLERILTETGKSAEEVVIDREQTEDLEQKIYESLSDFERQVLNLRLTGLEYTDIARILGRDAKSTDNALSRIKIKVRKILDK